MKTNIFYTFFFILYSSFLTGQASDVQSFLRDNLMVYYVENPSSDQYRLINTNEISSAQPLFGENPHMEVAQNLVRDLFVPESDSDFQQRIAETLRGNDNPSALFIYFDRGPIDTSVASANWTNCIENDRFTACVTREENDDYNSIIHYGSNLMNSDGLDMAKNRLQSLLGDSNGSSASNLDVALQDGVTLTFCTNYVGTRGSFTQNSHNQFEKWAEIFSGQHNAVGLNNQDIITGESAYVPVLRVEDIIVKATEIINRLRTITNNPSLKIKTIAIMTHGLNDYVNFGNRNFIALNDEVARQKNGGNPPDAYETAQTFARALDPLLDERGKVVLYACLSGSTITDNQWKHAEARVLERLIEEEISRGVDGCVAKALKEFLNADGANREVWAHRTRAHTTGNPAWRVFKGPNRSGPSQNDLPFINPSKFCSGNVRLALANAIRQQLSARNIQINNDRDFNVWIAMEIPFVSDTIWPLLSEEPTIPIRRRDLRFQEGVVDWFTNKWISHNPNSL